MTTEKTQEENSKHTETETNSQQSPNTTPAEELKSIDNTRGRKKPEGTIWHLTNFAPAIMGVIFIAYTGFLIQTNNAPTTSYYLISILIGILLTFINVDRDVYFKRLYNLQSTLQDHNIKLTNKTYTSYRIHYPQDNQAHTSDTSTIEHYRENKSNMTVNQLEELKCRISDELNRKQMEERTNKSEPDK